MLYYQAHPPGFFPQRLSRAMRFPLDVLLLSGRRLSFCMKYHATVGDLKKLLQQRFRAIPVNMMKVLHESKVLPSCALLAEFASLEALPVWCILADIVPAASVMPPSYACFTLFLAIPMCANCGTQHIAMKHCRKCVAYYCSMSCQRVHWVHHKAHCVGKKK